MLRIAKTKWKNPRPHLLHLLSRPLALYPLLSLSVRRIKLGNQMRDGVR